MQFKVIQHIVAISDSSKIILLITFIHQQLVVTINTTKT